MFPIIGQRFTPDEFAAYVAGIQIPSSAWTPVFCVLHNTSSPTLAQRPDGFTTGHMENLREFYSSTQHWSGGPHLFVDDHGIWVFNPLDRRGVHSPSWNAVSFGVEMLGEYDTEAFATGRGALVRDNAVAALAILCHKIHAPASTIRFHKEDPLTDHEDCPGANVVKTDILARVAARLEVIGGYTVTLDGKPIGTAWQNPDDSSSYFPARTLLQKDGMDDAPLRFDGERITYNGEPVAPALRRSDGAAWAKLRPLAAWMRLSLEVDEGTRTISLTSPGTKTNTAQDS